MDLVGGDGGRENDSLFVVVLLYGGGEEPSDADAVASHDDGAAVALVVEIVDAEGLAVEGSELEDVADLDAAKGFKGLAALDAGLAFFREGDIGHLFQLEVPRMVGVLEMGVGLVGPHQEVGTQ